MAAASNPSASRHYAVTVQELKTMLTDVGQEHILQFFDSLSATEQTELKQDIAKVDWKSLQQVSNTQVMTGCLGHQSVLGSLEPFQGIEKVGEMIPEVKTRYQDAGLRLVHEGKAGVLIFAGGQGTRLRFPHPKGLFDIGMPSHKSIFEYQVERVHKVQLEACRRYCGHLPRVLMLVMTNEESDHEVRQFFEENGHFGMEPEDVIFFAQGLLPAVTPSGQAILKTKSSLALSPNGNGGVFSALLKANLLTVL